MADLRVQYMGLDLDNPVVVSSSSLTITPEKVEQCAAAGAGAVVLKSLFEEEIQAEIDASGDGVQHTEAADYIREAHTGAGLARYASLISESRKRVDIPVIASINAASRNWWEDYVPNLVDAGASALELNLSLMPYDYHDDDAKVVDFYIKAVSAVRSRVSVPIAVKIGPWFTSIPAMVDKLKWAGADAVVLFNRFYQLDIDINTLSLRSGSPMSTPADLALPLRWLSLVYGKTEAELAASGGVHGADDAIKAILAGAQVVQVCSALYRNGVQHVATIRDGIADWMDRTSFATVASFRGKLSQKRSETPERFERLQYIKALVGSE